MIWRRTWNLIFSLNYPNYEIIFGVDALSDATVPFIRALQDRFPDIPVHVLATGHSDDENPKIFKLSRMEPSSRGELLWVTDANTRVKTDTLNRLVMEYRRSSAQVIFSPIRGTGSRSLASLMENMGLNLFTSGNIITAWKVFKQQIIVGKSMFIEKSALGCFGGFSYFREFLAEDFMIGEVFRNSGFKLSSDFTWIDNVNRTTTVTSYFRRMARWAKLSLRLKPGFYVMEICLNPIMLSLALPLVFPGIGVWRYGRRVAVQDQPGIRKLPGSGQRRQGTSEKSPDFTAGRCSQRLHFVCRLSRSIFQPDHCLAGGNVSHRPPDHDHRRQERLALEGA